MLWLKMTQVDVPKVTKTEITKVTKWLKLWSKDAEEDTAEWCPFSKFKKQMGFLVSPRGQILLFLSTFVPFICYTDSIRKCLCKKDAEGYRPERFKMAS